MNKILFITLALLVIASVYTTTKLDRKSQFEAWKSRYGFKYSVTEDLYRFKLYAQTMEQIEVHNADPSQTYKQGENQFTAMTQEEFVSYLNLKPSQSKDYQQVYKAPVDFQPLTCVNWSSCWAFSAVAGVEAFYQIKKNLTIDLSEQQLVDCVYIYDGCFGGYQYDAIEWIAENGILLQWEYPYTSGDTGFGGFCMIKGGRVKVKGYQAVEAKAASVKSALANYPLTVAVDANNWQWYSSGVLSRCGKQLNHAVLLVGYNSDDTWIIKNSWGTEWGEKGFITLSAGNTCGVLSDAGFAY
ncbi:hypothetical protein pb186bvf_000403 [Paramecium bursaria]